MSIYSITPEIINDLLKGYPHLELMKISEINAGFSGSKVLLVQVKGNAYNGMAFAKIDITTRCWKEYNNHKHALENLQKPYIPSFLEEPTQPIKGYSMVLYQAAHNSTQRASSLAKMIEEGYNIDIVTGQVQIMIDTLFPQWHNPTDLIQSARAIPIPELFQKLINVGDDDHFTELPGRIRLYDLPDPRYNLLSFRPGANIEYPNPFAYILRPKLWEHVIPLTVPQGAVHGDLHAGNIISILTEDNQPPLLIDFASYDPFGIPFFDLAYLELDLLNRYLALSSMGDETQWSDWVALNRFLNQRVLPLGNPERQQANILFQAVKPIRTYLDKLLAQVKAQSRGYDEYFEAAWWLSATVVGVLFARRSRARNRQARIANVLYAASALERLNQLQHNQGEEAAITVQWQEAPWNGPPYPGLNSFQAEQNTIFFGRNREIEDLLERIRNSHVVMITGASGSGKSSLVRAGILPILKEGKKIIGSEHWMIVEFRPDGAGSGNPFASLVSALSHSEAQFITQGRRQFAKEFFQDPNLLRKICEERLTDPQQANPQQANLRQLVLYIDQFEELFTLIDDLYIEPFIQMLIRASRSHLLRIIFTFRSDFLPKSANYTELKELTYNDCKLYPPDALALAEMVQRPAERARLQLQDELVRQIVADTDARLNPGGLALMAYTLEQLYTQSKKTNETTLTVAAYHELGGVRGTIAKKADELLASLQLSDPETTFTSVFSSLVSFSEDTRIPTRQRIRREHFHTQDAQDFLAAFEEARLLVADEDDEGQPTIEIAHEALMRSWPKLRDWVQETGDDIRMLKKLQRDARDWEQRGRPYTLTYEQIRQYQPMIEKLNPNLSQVQKAYLKPEQAKLYEDLKLPDISPSQRREIGERLAVIGDQRPGIGLDAYGLPEIDWCAVPPGTMAFTPAGQQSAVTVHIAPLLIARFPLTFAQYSAYPDAPHSVQQQPGNYPVYNISWVQALYYCIWLNEQLQGQPIDAEGEFVLGVNCMIRLPTEWEWGWVAGSASYPWGHDFAPHRANTQESRLNQVVAVGLYPDGMAPCGALDMIGNLWEWCWNDYDEPFRDNIEENYRVTLLGGSYQSSAAQVNNREWSFAESARPDFGFRLVCAMYPNQNR